MFKPILWRGYVRTFTSSNPRLKDNRHPLQKLGHILQKGQVGTEERKPTTLKLEADPEPTEKLALEATAEKYSEELFDAYDKIAYMTHDEILIQSNLDGGNHFGSYPSHFLDRKLLIKSIPDEIDVFNTPLEEIGRVYDVLRQLDEDKNVHWKYLEAYEVDSRDLRTRVRLASNLPSMCKAGRRHSPYEQAKGIENVHRQIFHYNVEGFDRSFLGVPLRSRKQEPSKGFPQELIGDLRPFDSKVKIHKADVDIIERGQLEESVEPLGPKPPLADEMLRDIGRPLMVDDVNHYYKMELLHPKLLERIEIETRLQRDLLYTEIVRAMLPEVVSKLLLNPPLVRRNEYVLTLPGKNRMSYRYREFPMVPVYGIFLRSRSDTSKFCTHLYKVMMANLAEFIDVLMRNKYRLPRESEAFMRKLYLRIDRCIVDKILPVAFKYRFRAEKSQFSHYDAVVRKSLTNTAFLRMYWISRPRTNADSGIRRRSQKFTVVQLSSSLLK